MRLLFLLGYYGPNSDASGNIVHTLATELARNGDRVDVLCQGAQNKPAEHICDGVTVYTVKNAFWARFFEWGRQTRGIKRVAYLAGALLRKGLLALRIWRYPNSETGVTRRMVGRYERELSQNTYDAVVAFFRPYACLEAGMRIAEEGKIPFVPYFLDLAEEQGRPSFMPLWLYRRLMGRAERQVFSACTFGVMPVTAREKRKDLYEAFGEKLLYLEFPSFSMKKGSNQTVQAGVQADAGKKKEEGDLVFCFAGTLDRNFRDPLPLLDVLHALSKRLCQNGKSGRVILRVFGGGDCGELLAHYNGGENFVIELGGKVSRQEIESQYEQADVLVNITNTFASLVPSKIFELFAMGKPILNLCAHGDDGSQVYFDRYPAVFCAQGVELEQEAEKLEEFVIREKGKRISEDLLETLYGENTPSYVSQSLRRRILGEGDTQ